MVLLQCLQGLFIALNGGFELANILGPPFPKGRLSLSVALLTLFRGGIDLDRVSIATNMNGVSVGITKGDQDYNWPYIPVFVRLFASASEQHPASGVPPLPPGSTRTS